MVLLPGTACSNNSRCLRRNPFPSTFFMSLLSKSEVERLCDKDMERKKKEKENAINFLKAFFS